MKSVYKDQVPRIQRAIDKWLPLLDMPHMDVRHVFVPARREDDTDCPADTEAKWQYRYAGINYYLPNFCSMDDEDVEKTVLHELVHVLINPIESQLPDDDTLHGELACENVVHALWRTHGN